MAYRLHGHCRHRSRTALAILLACCSACDGFAPEGALRYTSFSAVRHAPLLSRMRQHGSHRSSASQASLETGMTSASAKQWLAEHSWRKPPAPADLQQRNADFAMRAREHISAAGSVTEDLFLHWVLPYQHFDEPLDDWRPLFYERLQPHVQTATTLKEMAEIVVPLVFNGTLGNKVEFKANNTPQILAPVSETLKHGYASCTGLSILVANSLRSVGVPARVAGVAEWNQPEGGNHNWVEIWTGDAWQYLDAVPVQEVDWNRPWFADGLVQKAVPYSIKSVVTPVWDASDADTNYTVTWRSPSLMLPAIDRTAFYKSISSGS